MISLLINQLDAVKNRIEFRGFVFIQKTQIVDYAQQCDRCSKMILSFEKKKTIEFIFFVTVFLISKDEIGKNVPTSEGISAGPQYVISS